MDWPNTLIGIANLVVAILVVLIGENGLIPFLKKADIRYSITQDLKCNKKIVQGVLLVNRGKKTAKEATVKLIYDNSTISDINIDEEGLLEEPTIEDGGLGCRFVVVKIARFLPQTRVTIYVVRTEGGEPLKINGEFEGDPIQEDSNGYYRPLSDRIAILFGLFAFFWLILGVFFP